MDYSNRSDKIVLTTSTDGLTYSVTKTDDSDKIDTLTNIELVKGTNYDDSMTGGSQKTHLKVEVEMMF